jgi:hypothetical protein
MALQEYRPGGAFPGVIQDNEAEMRAIMAQQ